MENIKSVERPKFLFADQFILEDSANADFYALLLKGLTHKLNNLLAVIQGFSSLILMDEDLEETTAENLTHMKDAAINASKLSERILPAAGCSQISTQDLKISEFLPMVEESLKEPFNAAGIPINIKCPTDIPPITADPSRLKDIFLELLSNAAEAAADAGGQASFEIYKPGDFSPIGENRVDILIRNSGTVIATENMAKIWEPFYSSKNNQHLGIGLTTAAVLATQMNIKLGVHSAENITTFWLSSPVA